MSNYSWAYEVCHEGICQSIVCVTVLQCDTVPWRNEYVKCIVDTLLQCVAVCYSSLKCAALCFISLQCASFHVKCNVDTQTLYVLQCVFHSEIHAVLQYVLQCMIFSDTHWAL